MNALHLSHRLKFLILDQFRWSHHICPTGQGWKSLIVGQLGWSHKRVIRVSFIFCCLLYVCGGLIVISGDLFFLLLFTFHYYQWLEIQMEWSHHQIDKWEFWLNRNIACSKHISNELARHGSVRSILSIPIAHQIY